MSAAAREAIVEVLREHGWTCDMHEPDASCPTCRESHRLTADAILEALR